MNEEGRPEIPIPISCIDNKYLLFDIQAISWLRKTHNICGAFIGTLPQNPSQNVFLGLPMEIMPEEAQLLIENGLAYILHDARAHDEAVAKTNERRISDYVRNTQKQSEEISNAKARERETERRRALRKQHDKQKQKAQRASSEAEALESSTPTTTEMPDDNDNSSELFSVSNNSEASPYVRTHSFTTERPQNEPQDVKTTITPTTSSPLLPPQASAPFSYSHQLLPGVNPATYTLYHHLHNLNLTSRSQPRGISTFTTPGLRFGCQFCVYPSDPLRFHSHFLAVGVEWEEEIDLMDIVGGGRLGTGVKKGWLIGGREEGGRERVRSFSVEWAGM